MCFFIESYFSLWCAVVSLIRVVTTATTHCSHLFSSIVPTRYASKYLASTCMQFIGRIDVASSHAWACMGTRLKKNAHGYTLSFY